MANRMRFGQAISCARNTLRQGHKNDRLDQNANRIGGWVQSTCGSYISSGRADSLQFGRTTTQRGFVGKSDKPEKLRAGSRSIRADKVKVQKCEKTFRSHTAAGKFLFETVSVWRKPQYDETEDRNAVACGLQSTICSSSYGDSYAGAFCACVLQSYVVYVFFRKAYYVESYEL